jgi:transcriptional regulator
MTIGSRTPDRATIDSAKKGSADLLILALVDEQALHGYDIARRIDERSDGTLHFTLASLYATLYRLEERGLLRGRWVEKAGQRRRRYYRITDEGRSVLAAQRAEWGRFITALTQVAGVRPA